MYESFKEKVKMHKNKHDKTSKIEETSKVIAKLKQQDIDSCRVTLKQLFPECLDSEGCDISLMSGNELKLISMYAKTRKYLLKKYPQTQQKTKPPGNVWAEDTNALVQIDMLKAKTDPKLWLLFELNLKIRVIYDKLDVLQSKALDYEKTCLRLYMHLTYNWNYAQDIEHFRELLWSYKEVMFEIVENYFKICKKYQVPTFEEPYYFLTSPQQMEIKLEGDMLRRTGKYSDFEVCISILESFHL